MYYSIFIFFQYFLSRFAGRRFGGGGSRFQGSGDRFTRIDTRVSVPNSTSTSAANYRIVPGLSPLDEELLTEYERIEQGVKNVAFRFGWTTPDAPTSQSNGSNRTNDRMMVDAIPEDGGDGGLAAASAAQLDAFLESDSEDESESGEPLDEFSSDHDDNESEGGYSTDSPAKKGHDASP